jgi:hypothetical protein
MHLVIHLNLNNIESCTPLNTQSLNSNYKIVRLLELTIFWSIFHAYLIQKTVAMQEYLDNF